MSTSTEASLKGIRDREIKQNVASFRNSLMVSFQFSQGKVQVKIIIYAWFIASIVLKVGNDSSILQTIKIAQINLLRKYMDLNIIIHFDCLKQPENNEPKAVMKLLSLNFAKLFVNKQMKYIGTINTTIPNIIVVNELPRLFSNQLSIQKHKTQKYKKITVLYERKVEKHMQRNPFQNV
eukprot:403363513